MNIIEAEIQRQRDEAAQNARDASVLTKNQSAQKLIDDEARRLEYNSRFNEAKEKSKEEVVFAAREVNALTLLNNTLEIYGGGEVVVLSDVVVSPYSTQFKPQAIGTLVASAVRSYPGNEYIIKFNQEEQKLKLEEAEGLFFDWLSIVVSNNKNGGIDIRLDQTTYYPGAAVENPDSTDNSTQLNRQLFKVPDKGYVVRGADLATIRDQEGVLLEQLANLVRSNFDSGNNTQVLRELAAQKAKLTSLYKEKGLIGDTGLAIQLNNPLISLASQGVLDSFVFPPGEYTRELLDKIARLIPPPAPPVQREGLRGIVRKLRGNQEQTASNPTILESAPAVKPSPEIKSNNFTNFTIDQSILERAEKDEVKGPIKEGLGRNNEAFKYVVSNYRRVLQPLIETLREDPETKREMERVVPRNTLEGSPALKYRRRIRDLQEQRKLSETESQYFQSIELLTAISPYLVAAARADIGTTSVYLQNHFEELSKLTKKYIFDDLYIPLVVVGTGPNGAIAVGEIVRKHPGLAQEMLIVDQGKQPGGPFAIPNGPAWELNSANLVGEKLLPDFPGSDEAKKVRAFGNPERWYPGERSQTRKDTRAGSINKIVDWLPDPDDLSNKRYPTNEELQVMLALQLAVCANYLALETKLIRSEPDPEGKVDKILTLKVMENGNDRLVRIKTDRLIISTGLGEPQYGFPIKTGTGAEKVLNAVRDQEGLKKVSTTLEAFGAVADRTRERPTKGLGETIVIYGIGNSTDVLLEYFGRLFESGNQDISKVKKIYVIADGAPSKRPRYARNDDIRPRLGKENLVKPISNRVTDFDFTPETRSLPLEQRQLALFDSKGEVITDDNGKPIIADNIIAATGFQSELDEVFEAYLQSGEQLKDAVIPVTLPTNDKVSVADVLAADPYTLFVGTASNPRFTEEKLRQLPDESRDALKNIGAQNAVAIGFRGPDTQAATRLFLRDAVRFSASERSPREIDVSSDKSENAFQSSRIMDSFRLQIQDNVNGKRLISALVNYQLQNVVFQADGIPISFEGQFSIESEGRIFDRSSDIVFFPFRLLSANSTANTAELFKELNVRLRNEYLQRYIISEIRKARKGNKILKLNLGFRNGKVDPANTYIS